MAQMPSGGRVGRSPPMFNTHFAFAAFSLHRRTTKLLGILQARARLVVEHVQLDFDKAAIGCARRTKARELGGREVLVCCQRRISGNHGRFENRQGAMIRACVADDGQSLQMGCFTRPSWSCPSPFALLEKPLSAGFLRRRLPGGQGGRAIMDDQQAINFADRDCVRVLFA